MHHFLAIYLSSFTYRIIFSLLVDFPLKCVVSIMLSDREKQIWMIIKVIGDLCSIKKVCVGGRVLS